MESPPLHQVLLSFSVGVPTLEDALYLIFQMICYKLGGGLITCLRLGHEVSSLNCFSNETCNIRCTLILGGNSNLYTSLDICSTIGNKPPNLDMNFGVRPLEIVKLFTFNNTIWPTSYSTSQLPALTCFHSVFGFFPTTTWFSPKHVYAFWPSPRHLGWTLVLNVPSLALGQLVTADPLHKPRWEAIAWLPSVWPHCN